MQSKRPTSGIDKIAVHVRVSARHFHLCSSSKLPFHGTVSFAASMVVPDFCGASAAVVRVPAGWPCWDRWESWVLPSPALGSLAPFTFPFSFLDNLGIRFWPAFCVSLDGLLSFFSYLSPTKSSVRKWSWGKDRLGTAFRHSFNRCSKHLQWQDHCAVITHQKHEVVR